jgi:hypothetical protein
MCFSSVTLITSSLKYQRSLVAANDVSIVSWCFDLYWQDTVFIKSLSSHCAQQADSVRACPSTWGRSIAMGLLRVWGVVLSRG